MLGISQGHRCLVRTLQPEWLGGDSATRTGGVLMGVLLFGWIVVAPVLFGLIDMARESRGKRRVRPGSK